MTKASTIRSSESPIKLSSYSNCNAPTFTDNSNSVQPGPFDVICGRCKDSFNHPGNFRFRAILRQNLPRYEAISRRANVTALIKEITSQFVNHNGARFLKQQGANRWVELDSQGALKKVGHALRDMRAARRAVASSKCSLKAKKFQTTIIIPQTPEGHCEEGDNETHKSRWWPTNSSPINTSNAQIVSEDEQSTHTSEDEFGIEQLMCPRAHDFCRQTSVDSFDARFFHEVDCYESVLDVDFDFEKV